MSQKSKTTRTRIADLPVTLSEVPAEELAQVDGGMMANTGAALHTGLALHANATSAGTCTFCNDCDCNPD